MTCLLSFIAGVIIGAVGLLLVSLCIASDL